jgi:glycosyltransferase involved in cell wall biosynthesis
VNEEKEYYESKYNISKYQEQPFCIVVPSYNNVAENRYIKNLNSILQQNYSNYHIIFIDDASEDGTSTKVSQFAQEHQISSDKLKILENKDRSMAMYNIYQSAHRYCKSYEILMIVDGDDYLLGRQVLKLYNALFQSKNNWLIYTNFLTLAGTVGYSRSYKPSIIQDNLFRRSPFLISHLRAFYTKLLTMIPSEDLKDGRGNWFRAANDVAIMLPILEMARHKFSYVPELCSFYNSNTGLNNHSSKRGEQKENEAKVKSKPPYISLTELFTEEEKQGLKGSMNRIIPTKDQNLSHPQNAVKSYKW